MAGKDEGLQGKVEVLVKAKTALATFLETFSSQVMCADLTDENSKEDDMKALTTKLEVGNTVAETHLKGVKACLREANV